jgi:hypothetical protein
MNWAGINKYSFDIYDGGVILCALGGDCVMSICTVFWVLLKLFKNSFPVEGC